MSLHADVGVGHTRHSVKSKPRGSPNDDVAHGDQRGQGFRGTVGMEQVVAIQVQRRVRARNQLLDRAAIVIEAIVRVANAAVGRADLERLVREVSLVDNTTGIFD